MCSRGQLTLCGISANTYLQRTALNAKCDASEEEKDAFEFIPMKEGQNFGVFSHLCPDLLQDEDKFTTYFTINIIIK